MYRDTKVKGDIIDATSSKHDQNRFWTTNQRV